MANLGAPGRDVGDGGSPVWLAFGLGAGLWLLGTILAGWREAWDSPTYLLLVYPASLVAVGYLANLHPHKGAAIAFALFAGQLAVLFVLNPTGGLLPLGVIMFFLMALPAVLVARLATRKARARAMER
jgi:hypothetical protein